MGKLFIVGTPIGNMGDMTYRAVNVLREVDVVACEDTRHSAGLLSFYGVKKPLVSYYKPKEREGGDRILAALAEGKSVALISDAGMPCISDPGALLVARAREAGNKIEVVPGPSALTSAMAFSGILQPVFTFIGFLPYKKSDRRALLDEFTGAGTSLVFYCSPHDVNDDLDFLFQELGERNVHIVKELTKVHEGHEEGALSRLRVEEPRGEYVVIVEAAPKAQDRRDAAEAAPALEALIAAGVDSREAVKIVAKRLGLPKNDVYALIFKK